LGGLNAHAQAINNSGEIVGVSQIADGDANAFIDTNGLMSDLNSLVSLSGGVYLEEATGINDLGQIVADGSNNQAYLLTPVAVSDSYSSAYAVALGVAALSFVAICRRRDLA
jgi:probable HAF family extracellular repeat protein